MDKLYFTIAGTRYYFGSDFLEAGQQVFLEKEPDNEADREAIKVTLPGLGTIGYVANSTFTVLGESLSAGRLYDKIGSKATAVVRYKLPKGVLCELEPASLIRRSPRRVIRRKGR